jgi:hypothetical protein
MTQPTPFKFPMHIMLLDGVGVVLLSLGLAEQYADADILSGILEIPYRPYLLIATGIFLMLPAWLFLLNALRNRYEGRTLK